jgi:PTS system nitrogen regulatory IIA component
MSLASLTRPELIFPHLPAADSSTVLKALADRLAPELPGTGAEALYRKLMEREELGSTGIGSGIAIPHCKMAKLDRAALAIGITDEGVEFGAVDGQPVKLFILLVSPDDSPAEHLQVLASISRWVKAESHVRRILDNPDRNAIYTLLAEED